MNYRFVKKNKSTLENPSYDFGVDLESIEKDEEFSLSSFDWSEWNASEVQNIIDRTKSLTGEDFFDYYVDGSELRISIDNEYALFFDWRTETADDDFRWTTTKFLEFMEAFKVFLQSEGR
ncbi:hypothetical protein [uncultured Kordia sp.]|uniref:hypothetical protein n=1 Tax=uncultured Kordia sp. TaxID=507699 RepID=UPI0026126E6A|nr:hypothetical protein [uncultured Kordia sp.]